MLKLYPLFSGSSGNMYYITSPKSKILLDFGVSYKKAALALQSIGEDISKIDAICITHEHSDHILGIKTLLKKHNIPLFSTSKTLEYILDKYELKTPNTTTVEYDKPFFIGDITVSPFKVSHDAVCPVGYTFIHEDSTLTVATDLGYIDENVYTHLNQSNFSVIEANYDPDLLMYGPYPYSTKLRIKGESGHLSNIDTSNVILELAKCGKRDFLLGHISLNNNDETHALSTITSKLETNGFNLNEFNIHVATRDFSNEVYLL